MGFSDSIESITWRRGGWFGRVAALAASLLMGAWPALCLAQGDLMVEPASQPLVGPAALPMFGGLAPQSSQPQFGQQLAMPFIARGSDRDRALDCMALAIAYEAGNEPLAGQQAVGQVILNRLRAPRFPKSVCGVVFDGSERMTGCHPLSCRLRPALLGQYWCPRDEDWRAYFLSYARRRGAAIYAVYRDCTRARRCAAAASICPASLADIGSGQSCGTKADVCSLGPAGWRGRPALGQL